MSRRLTTAERIQRLLAILRDAASRPGGVALDDLSERFGLRKDQLERELEMAMMIGADSPEFHDMPFEVLIEGDRVSCRLFGLDRPFRLTPEEALVLTASAEVLTREEPRDSALRSGLRKVARRLGLEPGESVGVDLTVLGGPTGQLLDEAVRAGRVVRFRYWAHGTDVVEERTVDPWRVFSADGFWYLAAHDHQRGAQRHFRLDRIAAVRMLRDPVDTPVPDDLDTSVRFADSPTATLDLAGSARWVLESLTILDFTERDDGRLRVTVPVSSRTWLERLVLRLADAVEVVAVDPELGGNDLAATGARRVLARYRSAGVDR